MGMLAAKSLRGSPVSGALISRGKSSVSVRSIGPPSGGTAVTQRIRSTPAPQGLALVLSLLVLGVTSGDIGHAFAGGTWHALETTIITPNGGATEPTHFPDPTSHLAKDCPLCRIGRSSRAALSGGVTCFAAVGEWSYTVFLPEIPAPPAPHRRADTARAPPARLSV